MTEREREGENVIMMFPPFGQVTPMATQYETSERRRQTVVMCVSRTDG